MKDLQKSGIDCELAISAATHKGLDELLKLLLPIVLEEREKRKEQEPDDALPILTPHEASEKMGAFRISTNDDGSFRVTGKRLEQLTTMTDFNVKGALQRFMDVIERIGLKKGLERMGWKEDAKVFLGKKEISEYLTK